MKDWLQWMAHWGIWDIIGLTIALIPAALILIYLFPRKRIVNFYIDTALAGTANPLYSKVIRLELRNHTNDPIYVLSLGFKFASGIIPSPHGKKDAATSTYEIKFEGRNKGWLSDIDALVRPNQVVTTWIPIADENEDNKVQRALTERAVGVLRLKAQRISERPHPFVTLKIPV